jgi:hypothetical protein
MGALVDVHPKAAGWRSGLFRFSPQFSPSVSSKRSFVVINHLKT